MFGEMFVRAQVDKSLTVEGHGSVMRIKADFREKLPLCNAIYKLLIGQTGLDDFKIYLMQF